MMRIRERYLLVTAQIPDARHIEAVCRHVKRLVSRHQKSSSSSLSLETVIASALTHRDHCPGLNTTKSLGLDLNTAPMSDATLDKSVVIVKHKENSRNLRVSAEISLSLWRTRVWAENARINLKRKPFFYSKNYILVKANWSIDEKKGLEIVRKPARIVKGLRNVLARIKWWISDRRPGGTRDCLKRERL